MFRDMCVDGLAGATYVVQLALSNPVTIDARVHEGLLLSEDGGLTWRYSFNMYPNPLDEGNELLIEGRGFPSVGAAAGAMMDEYYARWLPDADLHTRVGDCSAP